MSQLDPELRRLIEWSRTASDTAPTDAPFGSATRLVSRWQSNAGPVESVWWLRLQSATVWLSVSIVAAGLVFWTAQFRSSSAYDFAPAYQLIARNIAP